MASSSNRTRLTAIAGAIVAAVLFIGLPFAQWLARVWVDYAWFSDMGQRDVFVTRITSQLAVGAVFAVVAFVILFVNMRVARSMAPRLVPVTLPEGLPVQVEEWLTRVRGGIGPLLDKAIIGAAVLFAFTNGVEMSHSWETFRLALSSVPFGLNDPQFGRDVGFFVFKLPAYSLVVEWLFGILFLTTLLTAVVHVLDGAIQPWAKLKGFAPHVKAHISVLLALFVLTWGFSYWIDIWKLDFSPTGQIIGAGYTDIHAQIPAFKILIVISLLTAVLLLANIRFQGWRLPAIALGVWVGASVLLGAVWPALVQQFVVAPNEASAEAPYIERNIAMTRTAFGLNDVEGKSFPASENLTAQDVLDDRQTLSNVRLWDPSIVSQGYTQLQSIRTYYEFPDVDVDRYSIEGTTQQVLISAREMNSAQLPDTSQTWVNRHLVYTHGFGIVMSPVNASDSRGMPKFLIGDVPPRTTVPSLKTDQPRIYFGELTDDYVVVDTGIKEFDFPLGDKNAEYEYAGKQGVPIGGMLTRVAWAMHLGSSQVLFSEYVKPESRVLMRRNIMDRVEALAPWLSYEGDPYPVLVDGRILWVIDAYTTSSNFPYSEGLPGSTINYMRNSVKVTIDAFDGTTHFYAFDPTDPVLAAWMSVFPSLVEPADKIPAKIREHFRYPQGLFEAQAEIYRTYHMTDPRVFYNKEDQWEIPGERKGEIMEPFFVLMRLPGEQEEHFYIMQPYTPRNRDNMIGWVAANSDPADYGKRTVYQFPKERVVLGPEQVSAQINQDAAISPQLSLWNQRGSRAIFGNMIVIPIKDSIVYVQPLYLQAETTAIPELTRVLVVYADKVEMERTLEAALLKVFGQVAPTSTETSTVTPGQSVTAAAARKLFAEATAAQKKGDWATYGAKIAELGKVLEQLVSAEASATK
ncbi:MAG: UPF0182 family protein [Coriobacteriia bacterium]|nr:UPF0182 family protein [Coriobacteriia bacterium]